jgi:predicted amidohydrolase YtcJ
VKADLVLVGAKVLTMNSAQPQAQAVAIKGERIVKVGLNADMQSWIGKGTRVINLDGKTVVPGLIDTHVHLVDFGKVLTWVDLNCIKSIEDLRSSVKKRTLQVAKEKWVIGRGWNESDFPEKRLASRADLDDITPDNPVILYHRANRCALLTAKH